jgi:uncharacterized protein DUF6370
MRARLLTLMLLAALAFAVPALAGDDPVTVTGTIRCAKCILNKADAKDCQDVLVAADNAEYYLVKNTVTEKFGHGCKTEKTAVVTGKVFDRDGRKWIEASKIEVPKKG